MGRGIKRKEKSREGGERREEGYFRSLAESGAAMPAHAHWESRGEDEGEGEEER